MAEVLRVLCPRGVARVKTGGTWKKTVKPVPGGIDDWSHSLHGADNNAVARDTAVGPPRRIGEFKQTALTDEILIEGKALVLRVRVSDSPPEKDVWDTAGGRARARIVAMDAETGEERWRSELREAAPLTLATRAGRVFFSDDAGVVYMDLGSGEQLWHREPTETAPGHRGMVGTLVAQDEERFDDEWRSRTLGCSFSPKLWNDGFRCPRCRCARLAASCSGFHFSRS